MAIALDPETLAIHRRRLQKLEQQQALLGPAKTPIDVALEIEDLRGKLGEAAAVPEDDTERFVLLRDLILDTRADMRELRRQLWIVALLPVLTLLIILIILAVKL